MPEADCRGCRPDGYMTCAACISRNCRVCRCRDRLMVCTSAQLGPLADSPMTPSHTRKIKAWGAAPAGDQATSGSKSSQVGSRLAAIATALR